MENNQECIEGAPAETKDGNAPGETAAASEEKAGSAGNETSAAAMEQEKKAAADGQAEEPAGLTEDEKRLVRNYALNDSEVRRIIIGDYLNKLKSPGSAPPVMQGDAGGSPVMAPRTPRDMREAALLAEALLKKR